MKWKASRTLVWRPPSKRFLKQLNQIGFSSALLKLNNQGFKLFEHSTVFRHVTQRLQVLRPINRRISVLSSRRQNSHQSTVLGLQIEVMPEKCRERASLFRCHVKR